jgi:hypothetical protein
MLKYLTTMTKIIFMIPTILILGILLSIAISIIPFKKLELILKIFSEYNRKKEHN